MGSPSLDRERTLLDQKEVYRQILDAIADMVLVKGEGSHIVWANQAFRDYYGMTNEQLRDIIDAPFNPEDHTAQYLRDDLHVFTTGEVLDIPDEPVTRHDGLVQSFHTVKSPIRDQDGTVRMTVGVSRNITEQKKVREELGRYREHLERVVAERTQEIRSLSDRLQIVVASLAEGIVALDAEGKVQLVNPAVEVLTGVAADKAVGMTLGALLRLEIEAADGPKVTSANLLPHLLGGHGAVVGWLKVPGGRSYLLSLNASPLIGRSGELLGSVLVLRDITLEKEVEAQRLRQQKLESVGVLAGGIAHDFNNILTGILGSLSVARFRLRSGEDVTRVLENAESACLRARALTSQLLTFAKGGAPVKKPLALPAIAREAAELSLEGCPISLSIDAPADLPVVEADEGQLFQVFGNLTVNARQAMPQGGTLRIRMRSLAVNPGDGYALPAGEYLRVDLEDTGEGIAPEHLAKIFDPYFTTKASGSGLGLASVHSIIARHGGTVTVSSTLGKGSCFSLLLPVSGEKPVAVAPAPGRKPPAPGRAILLLDDEPLIRQVMTSMLEKMGHVVVTTQTSDEAFQAFAAAEARGAPFHAAFIDLTLPGDLGGAEVVARLRDRHGATKFIVMSGYSVDPILAKAEDLGLFATLQKPFSLDSLRAIVERL
jgi:PAS domain S-box-containing protein